MQGKPVNITQSEIDAISFLINEVENSYDKNSRLSVGLRKARWDLKAAKNVIEKYNATSDRLYNSQNGIFIDTETDTKRRTYYLIANKKIYYLGTISVANYNLKKSESKNNLASFLFRLRKSGNLYIDFEDKKTTHPLLFFIEKFDKGLTIKSIYYTTNIYNNERLDLSGTFVNSKNEGKYFSFRFFHPETFKSVLDIVLPYTTEMVELANPFPGYTHKQSL